jgi:two-component system LytT family sensor kinase
VLLNFDSKYPFYKLMGGYMAWWTFWTIVQTFVLHRLNLSWNISVIDSVISNLLLAFTVIVTLLIYRFYQPGKVNRLYRFVYGIAITFLFCVSLEWVLKQFFADDVTYLKFLEQSIPIRFVFSLLIISFITLFSWLIGSWSEQKEQEARKGDIEKLAKEAELAQLRQQLQPHFLFNSLNSINSLVGSKPTEARAMIQQLSDFLRGTLKKDDHLPVKLSEELEHLKLYLAIEKVRFGHRLNIEIKADETSLNMELPALLLQPIVENAIKFGLYDITGDITIHVSTRVETNFLVIDVQNPFDSETQQANKGAGFGLDSIGRRLYLLYARYDLLATHKEGNIFIATFKIPQAV